MKSNTEPMDVLDVDEFSHRYSFGEMPHVPEGYGISRKMERNGVVYTIQKGIYTIHGLIDFRAEHAVDMKQSIVNSMVLTLKTEFYMDISHSNWCTNLWDHGIKQMRSMANNNKR